MKKKEKKEPVKAGDEAAVDKEAEIKVVETASGEVIEKLQKDLKEQKDKYLYLLAEFENYKKRVIREHSELMKFGNLDLIRQLLVVVDDFERVTNADIGNADHSKAIVKGCELAIKQFHDALKRIGVHTMESVGKPFDPYVHEAMGSELSNDAQPNTVIRELQKGYKIHDKILRPARVIISAKAKSKESEGDNNG